MLFPEHQGEGAVNLGSEPFPVGTDTSTRRVEPWSKATGTGFSWSSYWDLRCTFESYRFFCGWAISERRRMTWKVIGWLLIVYQVDRMIVDAGVLGYHRCGIRREDIDVIRILGGVCDGDIHGLQDRATRLYRGPLGPPSQIPLHGRVPPAWLSARLVQLYKSSRRALCKPYICTVKGEERYPQEQTIFVLVLATKKKVSWKNRTFPSLS